jgi:hypothetical protein
MGGSCARTGFLLSRQNPSSSPSYFSVGGGSASILPSTLVFAPFNARDVELIG